MRTPKECTQEPKVDSDSQRHPELENVQHSTGGTHMQLHAAETDDRK